MENELKINLNDQEKDLLLQDLCARLPYGVMCDVGDNKPYTLSRIEIDDKNGHLLDFKEKRDGLDMQVYLSECKPYLLPLSSMTEEQLYNNPIGFSQMLTIKANRDWENITINRGSYYKLVDWFNKNNFDYRGLIPMGLAKDATGLNIY